ncbi:MAG: DegT/DnrJ/EryC1/StrS family aminotransferase [Acidobacteria bacterium]|nr:DegT/DnrJ/EryC1/StrS family aminotransferase [Acidobacteriota bacterium]
MEPRVTARRRAPDLAILGGPPAFASPVHVGRPNLGDRARFLSRVESILDRKILTNHGPYLREFESAIAARVDVRHCVATANATVALEVLARALGLTGEVIVPSLTFVATAHAMRWQGLTPVFADVDETTHNLDPASAESRVTPRTSAILGVHLWGRPCDVGALAAIAKRHDLALLFDAAHAFGCTLGGRPIGGFGAAEVFSFHATKVVQSFEGGAITTNDDALAARLRLLANFGFAGYDDVRVVGTNAKMSEISAAMGLTALESFDAFVSHNRLNHAWYERALGAIPGISVIPFDENEAGNFQYVVAEVDARRFGLSRDDLVAVLHADNVLARRYFHPGCHRMAPYASEAPRPRRPLPVTERLSERLLCFPTGQDVAAGDIAVIARLVARAPAQAGTIARRLSLSAPLLAQEAIG